MKNQYENKSANDIWHEWSEKQRIHFMGDHAADIRYHSSFNREDISDLYLYGNKSYSDLPKSIKEVLGSHIKAGQYKRGGIINSIKNWLDTKI